MELKEYVEDLETNAMTLGAVTLTLKFFASQVVQHVRSGGSLDDAALASIKAASVQEMKSIEVVAEGVSIEQESAALNRGLALSLQMLDDVIGCAKTKNGC